MHKTRSFFHYLFVQLHTFLWCLQPWTILPPPKKTNPWRMSPMLVQNTKWNIYTWAQNSQCPYEPSLPHHCVCTAYSLDQCFKSHLLFLTEDDAIFSTQKNNKKSLWSNLINAFKLHARQRRVFILHCSQKSVWTYKSSEKSRRYKGTCAWLAYDISVIRNISYLR